MKQKLNCIMLIDDDEPTNFISSVYIEESQCTEHIQTTQSGQEAINFLTSTNQFSANKGYPRPDLIFLDINMPAMDGWEFLAEYKKLKESQHGKVIIIMLTTRLNQYDKLRAAMIPEISGFEHKPLTLEIINKVLREHFAELLTTAVFQH